MPEGRANADIFSIWFAHVRLDWARIIILDAPIGQILWCVRVEKVRRHFRHAFQVRDTSLKRNTVVEMFAAFSVGSFVLVQFRPVGVGGSSSLPVGVGGPMAIACKPSLSNCRGGCTVSPPPVRQFESRLWRAKLC